MYRDFERLWVEVSQFEWSLIVAVIFGLGVVRLYTLSEGPRAPWWWKLFLGGGVATVLLTAQELPWWLLGGFYKFMYTALAVPVVVCVAWRVVRFAVSITAHVGHERIHPHG